MNTKTISLLVIMAAFLAGAFISVLDPTQVNWTWFAPVLGVGLIALYIAFKIGDLTLRDAWPHAFQPTVQAMFFWIEMLPLLILPAFMLGMRRVRRSPRLLFIAASLYVFGVVMNRVNVFVVAYHPPYAEKIYFPAFGEFAITAGLIAALILCYRLVVTYLPVMPVLEEEER